MSILAEKMMTAPDPEAPPPRPGPNKIMQAMEDFDHLAAEASHLREQNVLLIDISNKNAADVESLRNQLRVQGDFFTRQIAAVTAHRDRLQSLSRALITRFAMIRECFTAAEKEALAESISINEKVAELTPADQEALDRLQLGRPPGDGTWRQRLADTKTPLPDSGEG